MLKLFKSPIAIFITAIFTIIFYISLSKTQQKNEQIATQIENISQENQELKNENLVLEEKLSNINLEEVIRNEFLLKKEGEYVVKIPAPPTKNEKEVTINNQENWKKWINLLF